MSREIVRAGWLAYSAQFSSPRATPGQSEELRQAYFAGAAILFQTIMATLDAGTEPSKRDLERMGEISKELDAFGQSLDRKYLRRT